MPLVNESWFISSHETEPTSPIHRSFVPGRIVKRKGLRNPYPMIRFSLSLTLPPNGLSESPAPVVGLTRRIDPPRTRGSPAGRRGARPRSDSALAVGGFQEPP